MNVLELFSGTGFVSKEFKKRGHNTMTVDWNKELNPDLAIDIEELTMEMVIGNLGVPDVIWIAFDCTTFSLAGISHHRDKNWYTGNFDARSEYAKKCDNVNIHVLELLERFIELNPNLIFFIENPRACLQKMNYMRPYEKYKYVITYCQYLQDKPFMERYMKPTNIWTNHPDPKFKPPCKNGSSCHPYTPRGTTTHGLQGIKDKVMKSAYPDQLIKHIVDICEEIN